MLTRIYFSAAVVVLLIAATVFVIWQRPHSSRLSVANELASCVSGATDNTQIISCSREKIAGLLTQYSTAELMTNISTGTLPAFFNGCHQVSHLVGEETYKKAGNLENALAQCTNACSFGCIHGAVGAAVADILGTEYPDEDIAHASLSEIEKIGSKYCVNKSICHAIGHILFINANDFTTSLNACDRVASGAFKDQCYQGVFMQGVGDIPDALILGDAPSQKTTTTGDLAYPCDSVAEPYRHACFMYLPQYENLIFQQKGIDSISDKFTAAAHVCTMFAGTDRSQCFEGIGQDSNPPGTYTPLGIFTASSTEVIARCDSLPTHADTQSCLLGRVSIMMQFDQTKDAADVCSTVATEDQSVCYNALFQFNGTMNAYVNPPSICANAFNTRLCLDKYQEYLQVRKTLPDYQFGLFGQN
ncbi:MAG TPA: hypothetical protein VMU25_03820 [Candidatus Paceibacterota bacterium]|nr:hypothetical protein [Candidatus Paceibacterota bacterium]